MRGRWAGDLVPEDRIIIVVVVEAVGTERLRGGSLRPLVEEVVRTLLLVQVRLLRVLLLMDRCL